MAKVSVYNIEGKEVDTIELNDAVFGVEVNEHLVHMAVVNQLANNRQGTQKAKTRSEVSGGGRKPWRQKGTGHARQGSTRSPQWTGGGVVFAPVPRDYSFKMNKKEKRAALKSALTSRVEENKFIVVDELKFDEIKTKAMKNVLANLKADKALVILNDNGMSIDRNVGAVARHLAQQRLKPQYLSFKQGYRRFMGATWLGRKIYRMTHSVKKALKQSLLPCSMFENMGFTYLGPVNGHDLPELTKTLRYAASLKEPVLLHVKTVKGKGFAPAERNPDAFHGVSPFDPETGAPRKSGGENFSRVFGRTLVRLARNDRRICALTAAMVGGTGLTAFAEAYPKRFFDVGIAEGCAASMAAGMAKQGAVPVFAVYSTFLQRSYDMLLHDIAIDGLHVVLAVDRAGLVGDDGETHHGVFDVAYLNSVPGITVYSPSNFTELDRMLEAAVCRYTGPVAVRYPRGGQGSFQADAGDASAVVLRHGTDITLAGYGMEINDLLEAAARLEEAGIQAEVVKWNIITPLETELLIESVRKTGHLLVAEECVEQGCVGVRALAALEASGTAAKTALVNCGTGYVPHGAVPILKKSLGLDGAGLFRRAMEVLGREE